MPRLLLLCWLFTEQSPVRVQIMASIGQMEFFYSQSPDVMRSCCMALQLLSVAIGSYLSGALVSGLSVFALAG